MDSWEFARTDLICPVSNELQRMKFHLYPKTAIIYSKHSSNNYIYSDSKKVFHRWKQLQQKKIYKEVCVNSRIIYVFFVQTLISVPFTFLYLFCAVPFILMVCFLLPPFKLFHLWYPAVTFPWSFLSLALLTIKYKMRNEKAPEKGCPTFHLSLDCLKVN